MRVLLSAALLAAAYTGAYAQSSEPAKVEETVIEGVGLSDTIPCEGRDIGVYGADNKINLTGACGNVVVHGDGHTVSVDQAKQLSISGAGHTVTATSVATLIIETTENTVTATVDGEPGSVTISGADQVANLTLESAAKIAVSGTQQTVNWSLAADAPEPTVDIDGIDNAVNRVDGLD